MSAGTWIGVAVLGGIGALGRFLLDGVISARVAGTLPIGTLPIGTLVINLSGAFLVGLLTGLAVRGDLLVLAVPATLGSYTTFSTWMLETHRLREEGELVPALANVLISVIAGIGAVAIGRALGATG